MSYPKQVTKTIKEFKYFLPGTVAEAVSILQELDGRAQILAGGTDLLPLMKLRVLTPEYVVNLKNIAGLDYIKEEGQALKIGTLTKISEIGASTVIKQRCQSIHEATKVFATSQIRNMATIGGNICRSSPGADMIPPLMTFDAEVILIGSKGERKVLLEDFFTGPGENILDREILTEIVVPLPVNKYGAAFKKLTRASADLAKVNCAVRITVSDGRCEDIRIALGAMGAVPIRAKQAEQIIKGKEISEEVIEATAQKATEEISPITDVRSTAKYRALVSKGMILKMIKQAIARAGA